MLTRRQRRNGNILMYGVFGLAVVFFGFPLVWVLSLSIRTFAEVNLTSLRIIPMEPTLDNYQLVLGSGRFGSYLWNSFKYMAAGGIGATLIGTLAGYGFSRFQFRFQQPLLAGVLALQLVSPLILMIALYRLLAVVGGLDSGSVIAAIYVALLVPLATYVMKGVFDGIPTVFDEAALVDGASRFQAFRHITLPLATPGLVSSLILTAIFAWGQFIAPFILLRDGNLIPVAVGIYTFQGTYESTATEVLAAGAVLAMLPAVTLVLVMQPLVVRVMSSGAVKG